MDVSEMKTIIMPAVFDTLYMVSISGLFSIVIGLVFGIMLYVTENGSIAENVIINKILGSIINMGRSIPFVIIIIAVFPFSKIIVGTSIGKTAAIVPLTIAAIPFVARLTETSFKELNKGVIEAALVSGATTMQIITKVLLKETLPSLISGATITVINIIGYSAMAGTIGGGGLGDIAIRYGYQRFRTDILLATIIILVLMVQIIQAVGNMLSGFFDKR